MDDRKNEVLAVAILFFLLTWLTVGLRVYVRAVMRKSWGGDDWWMTVTLAIFTVYIVFQIVAAMHGTGRHRWDLDDRDARIALLFWYLGELLYVVSNCCLKIALGIFYLRVAIRPRHIWCIRVLMFGTVIFGLCYLFLAMFQCIPVSEIWNNHPASEKCIPKGPTLGITYALGALNAFSDWGLGILPFFIVWGLKMKTKTKALVAGLLAFAAIGSTATIVRMQYIHTLNDGEDFLWATTDVAIWSTVEPGIGIAAGSIATLRPLLQNIMFHCGLASSPNSAHIRHYDRPSRSGPMHSGYQRGIGLSDLVPSKEGSTSTTITGPLNPDKPEMKKQNSEDSIRGTPVEMREGVGDIRVDLSVLVELDEEPPRLFLRDSFRHSVVRGSILSGFNRVK